ncbi:response regulator [Pedobacter sp. L105]|uniref:response regulator n=1 Tax=Pedobacter sp. L105 TaxID=1641871 RepID=UPI00131C9E55|nr:response regulator [Pedobacter sp. L105]
MSTKIELLVIDDDDINIFIIKKIVEKTGYETNMTSKTNGQLAIDHLKQFIDKNQNLPDLILIDINMPILNGWEFLDSYANLNIQKNIDMYMLSSSVYENDIERAKTYKAVKGFISKPLSIDHLVQLFENINSQTVEP